MKQMLLLLGNTPSMLQPLTLDEMRAMLEYRTQRSKARFPFTDDAIDKLYMISGGVPRDVLGLAGFAYEVMQRFKQKSIDGEMIEQAANEVSIED